jgi:hypothetical protein
MALFDDASLVVTPNGYKAGTLYSVIPNSTLGDMTVVRATTATRVNSAGLIESVANNVPRLDYSNGTCPSLLVEPQRTNVLTYSEQFATSWINNGATIISNDTTAPDGNLTADRLTATGGGFGVVKFSTWTAINKVASCFVKANTSNLFKIANASGGGGSVTFNLSTQAITATTGFTGSIESLPDGWFRCIAIDTLARSGTFSIGVTAIGESVFVWGSQLEAGSYATSYIPTTTASVTRNADVISKTGISSLIGQTEGTVLCDINLTKLNSSKSLFTIDNGTINEYIALIRVSSNIFRIRLKNSSGAAVTLINSIAINDARCRIGFAYKNGDYAMYVNGTLRGTSTNTTNYPTTALTQFILSNASYGQLNDSYNVSALWKTRLTNAELAQLTTL